MVRDLVCGLPLDADHAVRVDYHGNRYYFCSHDCRVNFEDRPDEYAPAHSPYEVGDVLTYPIEVLVTAIRNGETDLSCSPRSRQVEMCESC